MRSASAMSNAPSPSCEQNHDENQVGPQKTEANNSSNGDAEGEEDRTSPKPDTGGSLRFFKNGRFVLELSSQKAEASEKWGWVQVTGKTYYPAKHTAVSSANFQQESCTSHSMSDDSSVHSSPWQPENTAVRGTPRKQPTPRHGLGVNLIFGLYARLCRTSPPPRCLYRRPHHVLPFYPKLINSTLVDRNSPGRVQRKRRRKQLSEVLSKLSDNLKNGQTVHSASIHELVKNWTNHPKKQRTYDPVLVSPRKRFLRELEKCQDGDAPRKVKPSTSALSETCQKVLPTSAKRFNKESSYSIDSLLNHNTNRHDQRSLLRSILKTGSPPATVAPVLCFPPNIYPSNPYVSFGAAPFSLPYNSLPNSQVYRDASVALPVPPNCYSAPQDVPLNLCMKRPGEEGTS